MKTFAAAAGVLALTTMLGACDLAFSGFREEATDTWTRTYPISATGRLEISNTNGRITVEAGGTQVEVRAERKARGATKEAAEQNLKNVEIRETASADSVTLETKTASGRSSNVSVDYTVRVPAGVSAKLSTSNGEIEAVSLTGAVEMHTSNGQLGGRKLAGPVSARTTNGQIDVELATLTGDVTLGTTNGEVVLSLPKSSGASLALELTNGEIRVDGLDLEGGEKTRRHVNGTINGGGPRIKADTTNGAIRIVGR